MDSSSNEAPIGIWCLYGPPTYYATICEAAQSTMNEVDNVPRPAYIQLFQFGIALGLVGAEILKSCVHGQSRPLRRPHWDLVSGSSLALQLCICFLSATQLSMVITRSDSTSTIDMYPVAVYTMTFVAALTNSILIRLGRESDRRAVYHLVSTLSWSQLSLAPSNFYSPWVGVYQFVYGLAFLLDIFFTPLTSRPQLGVRASSLFENLSYAWINPILASRKPLTIQDLPPIDLPPNFGQYQSDLLLTCEHGKAFRHMFWKFLFLHHRADLVKACFLRLADDGSKLALPWFLNGLLTRPSMQLASLLFVSRVLGLLCGNYSLFYVRWAGVQYKAALCAAIHSKALRTQYMATRDTDISTLGEVDTERLFQSLQILLDVWSYPLQAILCLLGIAYLLPWQPALAVVLASVVASSLASSASKRLKFWTKKNMTAKDKRNRLTAEVFRSIKAVKFHGWESAFASKLDEKRRLDVQAAAKLALAYAMLVCLVQAIPFVLTLAAFGISFLMGHHIERSVVFSCILLFTLLSGNLNAASTLAFNYQTAKTCVTRIRDYLTAEESGTIFMLEEKPSFTRSGHKLSVDNIHIGWPGMTPLLVDARLTLHPSTLSVLAGPTGSGKSSLLLLLVRHLSSTENNYGYGPGRISFVSQDPFMMLGTIRDNILFGKRYEAQFYARVIDACALASDLSVLPDGDLTTMNGSATISGGQKARICLARAVYARSDIHILDDPLASIDAKLCNIIMRRLFGYNGLLKHSITIMSSNSTSIMKEADYVLEIAGGLLSSNKMEQPSGVSLAGEGHEEGLEVYETQKISELAFEEPILTTQEVETDLEASTVDADQDVDQSHTTLPESRRSIREYVSYSTSGGWAIVVLTLVLGRAVSILATYALKAMADNGNISDMPGFLILYAGLSIGQVSLYMAFILLAYKLCIIPTAKNLHKALVYSTLSHEMHYFERVPLGDILNYFTNDLARVDLSLSGSILTLLAQYGNIALVGLLLILSTPLSIGFIIPAIVIFVVLQRTYLTKLRELRNCDASSRATILDFLQDSEGGQKLFPVFGVVDDRIESHKLLLEANLRAQLPLSSINSWLAVRLELLCVTMQVLVVAALLKADLELGTVGLVMTYVFQITNFLNIITRTTALFEADFVSFTRLQSKVDIGRSEKLYRTSGSQSPRTPSDFIDPAEQPLLSFVDGLSSGTAPSWPSFGMVEFSNFSAQYRPGLPLRLNAINLTIVPGDKVAVVGRTGAGKSSLVLALLGVLKGTRGNIFVDGRNIAHMDPITLRRSFALIPQNPVIFSGSVRENLDPLSLHSDKELLQSLHESTADQMLLSLLDKVENKETTSLLDIEVDARSSLSAGQIQLLSLARAILHESRLLILDEATSSLPPESELRFQQMVWRKFNNATVISIMHRLESTLHYDKILVLEKGSVIAYGSPRDLVTMKNKPYCSMLEEAGLKDQALIKFGLLT